MKLRKRKMYLITTVLLMIAILATPVMAKPGKAKGNIHAGMGFGFKFSDVSPEHWAAAAIQQMNLKGVIKGYEDGTFKGDKPVTRLEAVIMALRILGLEDEARERTTIAPIFRGGKDIRPWAVGYISLAVDKKIIVGEDLLNFQPNKPATRAEVAALFARALDLEEQAQDHMDELLDFKDAAAIPRHLVGYVYVMSDPEIGLEYFQGDPEGNFKPNKPIKRAEMAVLLSRIEGDFENEIDQSELRGVIEAVYDDSIDIQLAGDTVTSVELADNGVVFRNNKRVDLEDLQIGDRVLVLLNDDMEAILIIAKAGEEWRERERRRQIEGILAEIGENQITVQTGTRSVVCLVSEDADIEIDGRSAEFGDLEPGQKVKVKLINDIVVEIEAETEVTLEGTITDIDGNADDGYRIKIEVGDRDFGPYEVTSDAEIELDGEEATVDNLEEGMPVKVKIENERIVEIEAESIADELEGIIQALNEDEFEITIKDEDGEEFTYKLAGDATIEVNGDEDTGFEGLVEGMWAQIVVIDNKIVEIEAEDYEVELEGTIVAKLETASTITITVEMVNEETFEFVLTDDVEVEIDGEPAEGSELSAGMEVEVTMINQSVVRIEADD